VALRIAFDLDGVLADMEGELVRQAEILFGAIRLRSTPKADAAANADVPAISHLDLSSQQEHRLWQHVETIPNFWESLAEIESGAVARLASLASERRWEIIFLTKRPPSAGATSQVQTQRWLEAKGFTMPSVFVVQRSRGLIADALALDFVVDDRPENCLDVVVDSRARAVLVWRDDEKLLPAAAHRLGVAVMKSVTECLDMLAQVETAGATPKMINRVMRMLGLKPAVTR
jgi:phosphoglycolate phosphatase-like HAD superfamily hydrolase